MAKKIKIAVGIVAAGAAAAAGYYFYGSKQAKQHRKIAAKWATDMKREVVRQSKSLEKVSAKNFAKVVDTIARTYRGSRAISPADVRRAANELKSNWRIVQREVEKRGKKAVKKIVKTARKGR